MSGADHWVGVNQACPHGCGATWGGTIPEGHYIGCPGVHVPTAEEIAAFNAENARVRAANAALRQQIADGDVRV